jgi:hypothetical protein
MKDIKILPEDKVTLTQDQKNLIELAFDKQVPPEDACFMEKVQSEAKNGEDPFTRLSGYFTAKYGIIFGMMYLSAIMGGKEKYKETVASIERLKALERLEENQQN